MLAVLLVAAYVVYGGAQHEGPGAVHQTPVPSAMVAARIKRQSPVSKDKGPTPVPVAAPPAVVLDDVTYG